MAAPNMTIIQLKKKVEREYQTLYPQNDPYRVGALKDMTGFNITNGSLVGEIFKHGDTLDVYPDTYEVDMDADYDSSLPPGSKVSSSNDLLA